MVTYLSLTRRLPFLNHSPAGSMAFTASYTVQKKRSRIQSASFICAGVSIGASSRTRSMGLSFSKALTGARARTMPSVRRFARVNGTSTRTPGATLSASSAGMA